MFGRYGSILDAASYKIDGRIVGGDNTTIERLPYQASIQVYGQNYCGGSVISKNWILTAAHCSTFPPHMYTIRVGSNKSKEGGERFNVEEIIKHKKYEALPDGVNNDIALFRLAGDIVFDATRQPIGLYEVDEFTQVGVDAVVSGYGRLEADGDSPLVLQSVVVPIISKEDCREAYEPLSLVVGEGQICAGYLGVGGKDSCQGDSGGPLAVNGRLAGVVSWGYGCAEPEYPGVYTEVAVFRSWIRENSGV